MTNASNPLAKRAMHTETARAGSHRRRTWPLTIVAGMTLGALLLPATHASAAPNRLNIRFDTGGDDLRGGSDNLNVQILLRSGAPISFANVNASRTWGNASVNSVPLTLPAAVTVADLAGIRLEYSGGSGPFADNWNLDRLEVSAELGGAKRTLLSKLAQPLVRFNGSQRSAEFRFEGASPPSTSVPSNTPRVTVRPASRGAPAPKLSPAFRASTDCPLDAPDCNPCTNDVAGQFAGFARKRAKWKQKPWRFEWGTAYPPYSLQPFQTFDEDSPVSNALGISESHPQGFVRTNSGEFPYAGSHSTYKGEDKPGSVFIVRQDDKGRKWLASLHRAYSRHPSGVHVLGKYVAFGDRNSAGQRLLRFIDIERQESRQSLDVPFPVPAENENPFGGGLGLARLANGKYLLLTSWPGSRTNTPHFTDIYELSGSLIVPSGLQVKLVNQSRYTAAPQWGGKDYRYSENLSVISECGTGNIYVVHTSGDQEGISGLIGGAYWRLSKLTGSAPHLRLTPVDVFEMRQNTEDCHIRSAATVGVYQGKLEFLCHQYRKDPDPNAANPLSIVGAALRGSGDSFKFRAGVLP